MIKLDFAPQPMVKIISSNISSFALHENLLAQQPYVYSFSKVRKSSTRRKKTSMVTSLCINTSFNKVHAKGGLTLMEVKGKGCRRQKNLQKKLN
jgi:hypothetical protein